MPNPPNGQPGLHFFLVIWFEDKAEWKGLKTFAMVTATREIRGKITRETRYFISSLPMDARRIAEIVRAHWGIENGLHWCLDIAFREDESRVRKGSWSGKPGLTAPHHGQSDQARHGT